MKDASGKFSASLDNIDASIDIGGVGSLSVSDGHVACLLYFGLSTSSGRIPFREVSSVATIMKQLPWQKGGILDVSLPIGFTIDGIVNLNPIISIRDDTLLDSELPVISFDLDIRCVIQSSRLFFPYYFEDIFKLTLLFVFNVLSGLVGKQ